MTILKCANSGCASNSSAVIGGGRFSSRVPVSSMGIGQFSAMSDYPFRLASKLLVGNPTSNDLFHDSAESLSIRQGAEVIPEGLFVQVPEQMKRLNADVGPVQTALQETPEVLHRVRMDVSVNVLYGVVNDGVLVFVLQPFIRFQFVTEDSGPGFNALPDDSLQFLLGTAPDVAGYYPAAALYHAEGNLFILAARPGDLFGPLVFVHIAGLPADEGFVYFDFSTKFVEGPILHGKTDAVKHEPCRLLGDTQTAMDFITANPVFAVDDKPCGREPLFERKRGVLKDGPSFEREAGHRMLGVALPNPRLCQPRNVIGAAMRAPHDAVRPAQLHHELTAMLKISEVQNRIPEGCFAVHDSILPQNAWYVNYIIAL